MNSCPLELQLAWEESRVNVVMLSSPVRSKIILYHSAKEIHVGGNDTS